MDRIDPLVSTLASDPALRPALARFTAGLPARLQAIATCLAAGDAAQAEELAHKLTGAAGMYGLIPIAEAARGVERDLRRRDTSGLDERLRALRALCERANAA